jgi:hypothetical protein
MTHQAMPLLPKGCPDNPKGIFQNFVDFIWMAPGRGLKILPKLSRWASGFPTYYQGSLVAVLKARIGFPSFFGQNS